MGDVAPASHNLSNDRISAVIFDLDGTLLNTEQLTKGILKEFLEKYGKVPDEEKENKRLGMTHKESAIAIVRDYDLPITPEQFSLEIAPMYHGKWLKAKAVPGANRLMKHLYERGIPFALASNSSHKNISIKLSHQGWKDRFAVILGSDQVNSGKPAPDIFLEAAKRMAVDAAHCLVIEDSVIGVKAGKAAGMKVLAVPSIQTRTDQYSIADLVLHSLLEFDPERWSLPPFEDWVENAVPIEPIYLKGLCSNGIFNELSDDGLSAIPIQLMGLYFGWAKTDADNLYKVVISIGQDHASCTSKRKIQLCIIDENNNCNNNCKIQILISGYIRGLSNVGSNYKNADILDEDKIIARSALNSPIFSHDNSKIFM